MVKPGGIVGIGAEHHPQRLVESAHTRRIAELEYAVGGKRINTAEQHLQLFGEHGSLTLRNPGPKYCDGFELTHGTRERVSMVPVEGLLKDRIDAVARVAHRFVDAILDGGSIEPNLSHGARVQFLLDAARDSHNRHEWVEV